MYIKDSGFQQSLENEIGQDYLSKLIKPKIGDIALTVIKEYTYDQIISDKKDDVKLSIQKMMQEELMKRHIAIEEIKISDIIISADIEKAITEKVEAEQLALKQQYVLDKERQEAERKRIEAEGISDFQEILIIKQHHRNGATYSLYLKRKDASHIALNARGDFISIKELAEKISKVINLPVKQEG